PATQQLCRSSRATVTATWLPAAEYLPTPEHPIHLNRTALGQSIQRRAGLSQRWLANPLHRGTVLGQSPLQSFRAFSPSLLSAKIIQRYGQWATLANRSEERRVGKEDHVRAVTVE